jgi:hypothetical protein
MAAKQLRDEALRNSKPGSIGVDGLVSVGPAKFDNALPPNNGWMQGAFAEQKILKRHLFGAYTGEQTKSAEPHNKYNSNGSADPCYLLHVPLKTKTYIKGIRYIRTTAHLYVDAGDPEKSGWCRYINTHSGMSGVCVGGCTNRLRVVCVSCQTPGKSTVRSY